MAALLKPAGERSHWVDVSGTGETEDAESCHGDLRDVDGDGPLSVREGGAFGLADRIFAMRGPGKPFGEMVMDECG